MTPLADGVAPSWHVAISPAPGDGADLFFEPPDGWWFDTKQVADGFDLILAQKPTGSAFPADVGLTYVAGDKAYETRVTLGDPAQKP